MTIEEAIKKAIEGGYTDPRPSVSAMNPREDREKAIILDALIKLNWNPVIYCDPAFWQALGKAMGWGVDVIDNGKGEPEQIQTQEDWLYYWHRFIDHLADGKSPESVFDSLK